jgi:hypothetical protein
MTFKEQIAADLANVILNPDEFAETTVYTSKGGTAKIILAVWEYDNFGAEFQTPGESWKKHGTVTLARTDIADPENGDMISNAAGEIFEVQSLEGRSSAANIITVIQSARKTVGHIRGK